MTSLTPENAYAVAVPAGLRRGAAETGQAEPDAAEHPLVQTRQIVNGVPADFHRFGVVHLRRPAGRTAAEQQFQVPDLITVRVGDQARDGHGGEAFGYRDNAGLLEDLPDGRVGRLLARLDDSAGQPPGAGIRPPVE